MNTSRFIVKAAPLGLFVIVCIFLAIGLTKDPSALPSNLIDKPLPAFELTELRGDQEMLTDQSLEGRITLLNVFGSWCQACLIEHPTLLRMNEQTSFDLVGVNWRDTRPDASLWLDRFGDPYDFILFDQQSKLAIDLGVTGAPETFVVDANLRIRYKHVGPITEVVFEQTFVPLIAALLEESAS